MAEAIEFPGVNCHLNAAPGTEHSVSSGLPVFRNGVSCVACWQLSAEELGDVIKSGGKVWVSVMFGLSQPPMFVGSEETVRSVNADYGVWKK